MTPKKRKKGSEKIKTRDDTLYVIKRRKVTYGIKTDELAGAIDWAASALQEIHRKAGHSDRVRQGWDPGEPEPHLGLHHHTAVGPLSDAAAVAHGHITG